MNGRPDKQWSFNYDDLQELTGKGINAIHQAASRGKRGVASGFNPDDFRSVVLWIFRNATDDFKMDIMTEMNFFRRGAKEKLQDRMREKGNKRSAKSPRK
jgi:hypothetical protein